MKKILLVLCLLPMACFAQPDIITTIAGDGTPGHSGDGGPATAARMQPWGFVMDGYGNIHITENSSHAIRKISTSGIISTIAGTGSAGHSGDGGPATAAQLDSPAQLAQDAFGNIFFCEYSGYVRKINTAGIISTLAGTGSSGYSGDGGPASSAQVHLPEGIAIDVAGNIYFSDSYNNRIRKINTAGIITTYAGTGASGYSGDGGPATSAVLQGPRFLFLDHSGNLLFSESSSVIRKVNATTGIITTVAGTGFSGFSGDGGPATAAQLDIALGIGEDVFGSLYIADMDSRRVRKVDPAGIMSTFIGSSYGYSGDGGPATAALLQAPVYVYFNNCQSLFITDLTGSIRKVSYRPTYSSDSFKIYVSKFCSGPKIQVEVNNYSAGMYVKTYFGDGGIDSSAILASGSTPPITHNYLSNGSYSVKQVLFRSGVRIDSFMYTFNHVLCNSFPINFYYDANGNCAKDTGDVMLAQPLTIEVDSNGVAIDTLSATSGLYYTAYGNVGDVYAFRDITMAPTFHITCPTTGIIYDTISIGSLVRSTKYVGFDCTSTSAFDLGIVSTAVRTGVQFHTGDIYASNAYCPPVNATVTLRHSPKHTYRYASPTPASTTATSVTWNLSALTSVDGSPTHLYYHLETPGAYLTPGDTVHSNIVITPDSGDADTSNNVIIIIDTVKAGYDPNAIYAKPAGCIASGTLPTEMQYTITFENTGNDTAHNIYVMDTLPDYVDASTMRIVMASHEMYTSKIKDAAGHNILKFDFPKIKLLDSSHHGLCNGTFIYDINTKPGLAIGTNIMNRVGIYFDVNPVVMTNEAITAIGCPVINEVTTLSPKGELSLYPNPANDLLNIKLADNNYTSFAITNNIGSIIMSGTLNKTLTQINIQSLPAGLYFINLKGEQGSVVKKVVKW